MNLLTRTSIKLRDNFILNLGSESDSGFDNEEKPYRNMVYSNNFQVAITYEMSMTRREFDRQVYSSLQLGSDLGGLFTALSGVCLLIIKVVNYYGSY